VTLWDTTAKKEPLVLHGLISVRNSGAFGPDGSRLVWPAPDRTLKVLDTTTGRELLILSGLRAAMSAVAFSPDGHRLFAADQQGYVSIWDGTPWPPPPQDKAAAPGK
jgi:WD40 repeat protein